MVAAGVITDWVRICICLCVRLCLCASVWLCVYVSMCAMFGIVIFFYKNTTIMMVMSKNGVKSWQKAKSTSPAPPQMLFRHSQGILMLPPFFPSIYNILLFPSLPCTICVCHQNRATRCAQTGTEHTLSSIVHNVCIIYVCTCVLRFYA